MIIGAFLGGGGFILWGAVPVFEMILVANVIWALAEAFTSGAWEAWITDEVGEAAAAPFYLRASQVRLVAGLIGLPLAIFFALMSLQLPFIIAGSVLIAVGIRLVGAHPPPIWRDLYAFIPSRNCHPIRRAVDQPPV